MDNLDEPWEIIALIVAIILVIVTAIIRNKRGE